MPSKHNARHRDKFEKANYRVTNWSEYNESLRQRGDVTVWFSQGQRMKSVQQFGGVFWDMIFGMLVSKRGRADVSGIVDMPWRD